MKAICQREGLLMAFQLASAAVPAKEIKPILNNMKAEAKDGRCTLIATDLELGIRLDVLGLTIQEPGDAILPAQSFLKILREAHESELSLDVDNDRCIVTGKSMHFEMPSEDPALFPDFPTFDEKDYYEISAGCLRDMIRRTAFATAAASERYTMTGVLWDIDEDKLKLIATDGRRLALAEGKVKPHGDTAKGQSPIVPTKAMMLLERNLQDEEEVVKVCIRPNEVLFRTELAVIYSRLVEGRFPDYRAVFPKDTGTRIPFEVGPFHAAVRQAAVMTEDDSRRVTFHFEDNTLTMKAQGAKSGRSQVEMPINYDGAPVDIHFNPIYVQDMLKILPPDEEIGLNLVDGKTPALFKSGDNYKYLVMPLS